jgi:hypothetical protein
MGSSSHGSSHSVGSGAQLEADEGAGVGIGLTQTDDQVDEDDSAVEEGMS